MYNNYDPRLHDAASYRQRRSDLMGQPPMIPPPVTSGAPPPSYNRGGGHASHGDGAVVPSHMGGSLRVGGGGAGFNGYPPVDHGVGRGFDASRSDFTDRGGGRGLNGRGFSNGGIGGRRGDGRIRESGRGAGLSGWGFELGRGRGRNVDSGSFSSGRGGGRGGFDGGHGGRGGRPRGDDLDSITLPKQDFGGLVSFKKDFYVESPSVRAMTEQEVMMYRARREITVEGHDVPKPIRMFQEANFPSIALILY